MTKPVRIQRRRVKGYDMQAESRAINGLECVYVGRPTKWGNPIKDSYSAAERVRLYRRYLCDWTDSGDIAKRELRGKNLVCWCALDAPCHADVLLEIANAEDRR